MENLKKRLEKKGWRKLEIERAIRIIQRAKQDKTKENIFLERRIFWILIVVITVANFAVSVALMPLLVTLNGFALYFIIITLGIVFGLAFELVIRTIEHLQDKHHFALMLLIPVIALANIFLIAGLSNDFAEKLGLHNINSPLLAGLAYAVSFALPYFVQRFVLKIGYYAKE
ncbi:hypothetical protein HY637_06080 [Candidatus Woesearchaeota archaeon]|nr:hypothetical protein [Candidatus Woesearchaeota archaeon]